MTAKKLAFAAFGLAIFGAAAWILYGILRTITVAQITDAIHQTSTARVLAAILATAVSFAGLAYYDRFATQLIAPGAVAGRRAWWVGAVSHALSNTLGFHAVTGGALRYRFYRQDGLSVGDIARLTIVVGGCVVLGSVTMLVSALLLAPSAFTWGPLAGVVAGLVLLIVLTALPAIARRVRRGQGNVPPFERRVLIVPVLVGLVEASAAILALYVLLPGDLTPDLVLFAAIVLGATALGLLSHAPGGAGVFEATVLSAFPADRHADVLAALLLYRLIYNLAPFSIAVIAVGWCRYRPSADSVGRRI
jgi:glycosyltransferase 2 family protein